MATKRRLDEAERATTTEKLLQLSQQCAQLHVKRLATPRHEAPPSTFSRRTRTKFNPQGRDRRLEWRFEIAHPFSIKYRAVEGAALRAAHHDELFIRVDGGFTANTRKRRQSKACEMRDGWFATTTTRTRGPTTSIPTGGRSSGTRRRTRTPPWSRTASRPPSPHRRVAGGKRSVRMSCFCCEPAQPVAVALSVLDLDQLHVRGAAGPGDIFPSASTCSPNARASSIKANPMRALSLASGFITYPFPRGRSAR